MRIRAPNQIGQAIRMHRKNIGLTQEGLAKRSGLLPKTISAIENGHKGVELASMFAVLNALELDLTITSRASRGE